jgi:hypothetical protein
MSPQQRLGGGKVGSEVQGAEAGHATEQRGRLAANPQGFRVSPRNSTTTSSAALKPSGEVSLENWYLVALSVRTPSQNGGSALGVGGTLRGAEWGGISWLGGPVVERLGSRHVRVSNGQIVNLVGDLNAALTTEQGFGESILRGFGEGFPATWQQLIGGPRAEQLEGAERSAGEQRLEMARDGKPAGELAPPAPAGTPFGSSANEEGGRLSSGGQGNLRPGSKSNQTPGGRGSSIVGDQGNDGSEKAGPPTSLPISKQAESSALEFTPAGGSPTDLSLRTPVQPQPSSVLKSHSRKKKGRTSETSDQDVFFTPDSVAAPSPVTRSRLKAVANPENTPQAAGLGSAPQIGQTPGADGLESRVRPAFISPSLPVSSGRSTRGESARQQARGLSGFLLDEGDDADTALNLDFPPVEYTDNPGVEVPESGEGLAGLKGPTEAGERSHDKGIPEGAGGLGKEDSDRTVSDRPNGEAGEREEGEKEVDSGGGMDIPNTPKAVRKRETKTPTTVRKSGRKSALRSPETVEKAAGTNVGSEASGRKESRKVGDAAKPVQEDPDSMERSPSVIRKSVGSADESVKGLEAAAGSPSSVRKSAKGRPKGVQVETEMENQEGDERAERREKRRRVSEGRRERSRDAEQDTKMGGEQGGAGQEAQEEGTASDAGPKEESELREASKIKPMSETKKRLASSRVSLGMPFGLCMLATEVGTLGTSCLPSGALHSLQVNVECFKCCEVFGT